MVLAIRQIATVSAEGSVNVRSPELAPGSRVEIIILLEKSDGGAMPQLAAFDLLQKTMNLDEATAEKWIADAHVERESPRRDGAPRY